MDEGKPGRPKWGFRTTEPDSSLVLQVGHIECLPNCIGHAYVLLLMLALVSPQVSLSMFPAMTTREAEVVRSKVHDWGLRRSIPLHHKEELRETFYLPWATSSAMSTWGCFQLSASRGVNARGLIS